MSSPEIAVAYLSIVPEIQSITPDLRRMLIGPANNAGGQAGQQAGDSLASKLKLGAAAAGIAAGALLVQGITEAMNQADITSTLQAQLGATGADAKKYGDVAGQLYSKGITENFQQGADAIRAVVQGGLVPPDATNAQLREIASQMTDVANVFGTDMGMQTQAVSAMLKNDLAPNAREALDVITYGLQNLGPNAEDLLETFQEYSVQLTKLGVDSELSLGLFQQGLQAGARDTDIIADAMKEFSIRAIDMSDTSRDAYEAIGLSAEDMERKIGAGGESARQGLDQVLDGLRAMKDPVAREAAAVGLFGTQAEDLGDAFFALDPSSAVQAIGDVGGSAKELGETIHSGPAHEIEVFKRRLQQGLTEAIGKYALPAILSLASAANDNLGPAIRGSIELAGDFFGFLNDAAPWVTGIAVAVGLLAVALNAHAIASGISTAVTWVQVTALSAAAGVTGIFSTAMGILNAIMLLNPFVLVAIALAALVAGMVVAYNKSETFREIVQAAWKGIQDAAEYAWEKVLKPVFNAIADVVTWLWDKILKPYIDFYIGAFELWWKGVKLYIRLVMGVLEALADTAIWLWNKILKPYINLIIGGFKLWWQGVKLYVNFVIDIFETLADSAMWLWNHGIKPPFNFIRDKIQTVWEDGIKPAFNAMKEGVRRLGDAFKSAKDFIKEQWDKLKNIAKAPIGFIINTVYNSGIVGVWNKIASAFGAPRLSEFHPRGFARGGILPGYTPGRDVHLAALSGGEAIMRPEWTRAMGPGYVHAMNAAARGGGVGAVRRMAGLPAFSDGGIFGWIGDAGSAIAGVGSGAWDRLHDAYDWIKDTMAATARAGVRAVVNPLLDRIPGLDNGFGRMVKRIPNAVIDALFGYSEEADRRSTPTVANYNPNSGVEQWRGIVQRALAEVGQSSSLADTTLRRMNQESGGNPAVVNKWDSNWQAGHPSVGLMQVIRGTFDAYAGKYRNKGPFSYGVSVDPLANVYASMRYALSRYGSLSAAYNRTGGYDAGGWLQPGATLSVNATGKPEPVLTSSQWQNIATLAANGSNGLQPGDRLVLTIDGRTQLEAYVDKRADDRITRGLVDPAVLGRTL